MRNVPLRRRLFLLAAAGLFPLALMSGIGLLAVVQEQREQAERASLDLSRAMAAGVDSELKRSISALEVLAVSAALDAQDLEAFRQQASRALATQPDWQLVLLAEPGGKVVARSDLPIGDTSPEIIETPAFERVVRTKAPAVGNLLRGRNGRFGLPLRVPVMRDGELRFVLSGVVRPQAILSVVQRQRVPPEWLVSVFDAQGKRVARSRAHDALLGGTASPSLQALLGRDAPEGTGLTLSLEGEPVYTAYSRLPDSGWTVAIGVPRALIDAASYQSIAAYGGGILLSLVLGGLGTLAIAGRVTRPIGALREAAQALGRGAPQAPPESDIRELQELADALAASAAQQARDEAERNGLLAAERKARSAAEAARQRLELLAAAGTSLSRSLEPQATLAAIASTVVPAIADWCRVDLLDAEGVLQRAATYHSDPEKSRYGAELVQRLQVSPETRGSMAWTVATGESHLIHFAPPRELDAIRDRDLLAFAQAIGLRAYYIVPLVARGRTLGALAALQAESGRAFTEDDCALISELAQRAALALDNARLYAEAEATRRQAEQANRAKDEFLAMLGHELRNPLAPIVTALHLMERRADDSTTRERRIIERQVAHLLRLVDDLLDVSRITKGKIQLRQERVDMKTVIARAVELTQPVLAKRQRGLDMQLPPDPVFVAGDSVRLTQVLCNLLTNAAKFTPPDGRIALDLHTNGHTTEITVADEGSGIEPELLPRIFDLFTQGQQTIDRTAGGLGLGLAIVKTLVQMHGGSVTAHSDGPGRGSLFRVRLPLANERAPIRLDNGQAVQPAYGHGRLLIVDDNLDAAATLGELLRQVGYQVRTASDSESALALLDSFLPDLAVLDIGLPGMDGYELAHRLRSDPRTSALRLVALTGYGREGDRARALASRFDEHLAKPVPAMVLLQTIQQLLAKHAA